MAGPAIDEVFKFCTIACYLHHGLRSPTFGSDLDRPSQPDTGEHSLSGVIKCQPKFGEDVGVQSLIEIAKRIPRDCLVSDRRRSP